MKKSEEKPVDYFLTKYKEEPDYKEKIKLAISSMGFLLEQEAERKLHAHGYSVSEGKYQDEDENGVSKTRQIDIFAMKEFKTISFHKRNKVAPTLIMVGECKYFSERSSCFLFTKIPSHSLNNTILRFPIFLNGDIYSYTYNDGYVLSRDLFKTFGDVPMTRRVNNFHFASMETDRKEITLYRDCEDQVLPATKFYFETFLKNQILFSQYRSLLKFPVSDDSSYHLPLYSIIPIVITNRELIEAPINEKFEIENLSPVPYLIYNHTPTNYNKFKSFIGYIPEQAIFIINIKHFEEGIQFIENGYTHIIEDMEKNINPASMKRDIETYKSRVERLGLKLDDTILS